MKTKALLIAAVMLTSGSANAALIAGWDFSQYFGSSFLSTDGASFSNTLDANYSSLDPTFGAGAESNLLGTLYFDGTNGSTVVNPASATAEFIPVAGSLASNLNASTPNPFDSFPILTFEGQTFTNLLSMTNRGASVLDAVFQADISSLGLVGSGWDLSFGAQTFSGAGTIEVSVSTDGVSYGIVAGGLANVTTVDTPFSIALGGVPMTEVVFVKLSISGTPGVGVNQIKLDNLAISAASTAPAVPEPGTLALVGSGLVGLLLTGRRRS